MPWVYPSELLEALLDFGLSPTSASPPVLVRDALSDLYRYELRRLRDRLREGEVAKPDYIGLVIATRKKYWPLTMMPKVWERICQVLIPNS